MQCRNCGIEIADKAIVCYKCGTATTEARYKPVEPPRRRTSPIALIMTLVAVALIVGYAILTGRGAQAGSQQTVTYIAVALAVIIVAIRAIARRR